MLNWLWSVATKELIGENGVVKGLRAVEVDWAKEEGGRWRTTERPGTEFEIETNMVLLAMGFLGPVKGRLLKNMNIRVKNSG